MSNNKLRKLYDELDQLVNNICALEKSLPSVLTETHWNEVHLNVAHIKQHGEIVLCYIANRVIPDLEKAPEEARAGGIFLNGIRV